MRRTSIVGTVQSNRIQLQSKNNTILIADDDIAILDAMKMILEFYGFNVVTISDGSVIPLLKSLKPKLLFLDIYMSGSDGKDICKELKENEEIREIPVVMISASCELVKVVKEAGADDYLPKPFEVTDLLSKVNKYLLN